MDDLAIHNNAGGGHDAVAHDLRHVLDLLQFDLDAGGLRGILDQLVGGLAVGTTGAQYLDVFHFIFPQQLRIQVTSGLVLLNPLIQEESVVQQQDCPLAVVEQQLSPEATGSAGVAVSTDSGQLASSKAASIFCAASSRI